MEVYTDLYGQLTEATTQLRASSMNVHKGKAKHMGQSSIRGVWQQAMWQYYTNFGP